MRRTWARKILLVSVGLGLVLGSNLVQAAIFDRNGNKIPDTEVNSSKVNWELLSVERGGKYNGVGLLAQQVRGICTAFFLDTNG
ncbi:MAG TPA: serine protease, partial [Coleofasciculaceae cyanobacterium]